MPDLPLRSHAMKPSTASRMLVRVDSYENGMMNGRMYCPYLKKGIVFHDFVDLVDKMDRVFDMMDYPRASVEYRSFPGGARKKKKDDIAARLDDEPLEEDGGVGNLFVVHVQMRNNADWQGNFSLAGRQETTKRFKSTMELTKFLDGHLSAGPEDR